MRRLALPLVLRLFTSVLGAGAIIALFMPQSAQACAACACGDPTLTVMGMGKPFTGRLRLSLEETLTAESSGGVAKATGGPNSQALEPAVDRMRARTALAVSAVVAPRLTLSAEVAWTVARSVAAGAHPLWTAGLSDATVRGRFLVFQDRAFVPRHLVSLTGGYRVPSPFAVQGAGDAAVGVDDQPSLGAHVFEAGLLYSAFPTGVFRPFSAFVSARAFAATPGFDHTLPGPGVGATVTGQFQPTPVAAIQMGIDTRSTLAAVDTRTLGAKDPTVLSPAGHVAMAHVGIVFSPMTDLILRLLVRAPLIDTRAPTVQEGAHLLLGATWDI